MAVAHTPAPDTRARYLDLRAQRDPLRNAATDHEAASSRARELAKSEQLAQKEAALATRGAAATAAGLKTFRTSSRVKVRYAGRKDARAKAEEGLSSKAESAADAARGATEQLDGLRATLKEAQAQAQATETRAQQFAAVEREMGHILEATFGGEQRGNEEENEAERAVAAVGGERQTAARLYAVNAKAAGMVNKALALLLRALRELRTARTAKNADLFLGGGFGFAAGATTQIKLRNAMALAAAAEKELEAARQVQPALPLRGGSVGVKGGFILGGLDLVFDNILSDFVVRQQVQKSFRAVQAGVEEVTGAKRWVDAQAQAWRSHLSGTARSEQESVAKLRGIRDTLILSEEGW